MAGMLFFFLMLVGNLHAGEQENLRARVGIELFPSVLSADIGIKQKQDVDGKLRILVLYHQQKEIAEDIARYLNRVGHVKGIPLKVEQVQRTDLKPDSKIDSNLDSKLNSNQAKTIAGIFIAEHVGDDLPFILQFAEQKGILVFSPFEGDVERGAPAGIYISDRIFPYVNIEALNRFNIRLKPFFLKISEKYGHQ